LKIGKLKKLCPQACAETSANKTGVFYNSPLAGAERIFRFSDRQIFKPENK
jgi:hypothetical protein